MIPRHCHSCFARAPVARARCGSDAGFDPGQADLEDRAIAREGVVSRAKQVLVVGVDDASVDVQRHGHRPLAIRRLALAGEVDELVGVVLEAQLARLPLVLAPALHPVRDSLLCGDELLYRLTCHARSSSASSSWS